MMYGMLEQFPAIERHDEVICSRDMAPTVLSGPRKCVLIAAEYVGSTRTWNTYARVKSSN